MNALLFPLAFVSPAVFLAFMLGLKENKERPVLKALALGLCAGIAFYGMRCDVTTDIYRHIALLPAYDTTFLGCFDAGHYGGLFVWDMWCWVIEKIGDPYLLQSSAAFMGYAIIGYICIDYSTRQGERCNNWVVPFLFAVCAIPVFPLVAGIRSTIAVLICALAFYLYNMKGCPMLVAALLDVMAVMIHQVALFPLVLLAIIPLARKWPKGALVGCFAAFMLVASIGQILLPFLPGGNNVLGFVRKAIEALLMYDKGDDWTAANASSLNGIVNRVSTLSLICTVLVCSLPHLGHGRCDDRHLGLGLYVSLIAVASAALIVVLPVNGERFLPAAYALAAPLVYDFLKTRKRHKRSGRHFIEVVVFLLCAAALCLHVYSLIYGSSDTPTLVMTCFFGVLGALFDG